MDKTKGEQDRGWEVGMGGEGWSGGGKWTQLYLNSNKKNQNIYSLVDDDFMAM